VDGATVAVSMGATTMADENTTLGDAAIPAAATVADMPTARSGVVTPAVVSVLPTQPAAFSGDVILRLRVLGPSGLFLP
jgi:hypothetical protein